jgi:hypothetical protein
VVNDRCLKRQVSTVEANESEPLKTCRNTEEEIETRVGDTRVEQGQASVLDVGLAISGNQKARLRSRR